LGYELKKDNQDLNRFIQELPYKLKIEVSLYIYEARYSLIKFFKDKGSASFISWMCPMLKPEYYGANAFIYQEGDDIKEIHFLITGTSGFVLPSFRCCAYIQIEEGDNFGVMDIIGSTQIENVELADWYAKKQIMKRQFTV